MICSGKLSKVTPKNGSSNNKDTDVEDACGRKQSFHINRILYMRLFYMYWYNLIVIINIENRAMSLSCVPLKGYIFILATIMFLLVFC